MNKRKLIQTLMLSTLLLGQAAPILAATQEMNDSQEITLVDSPEEKDSSDIPETSDETPHLPTSPELSLIEDAVEEKEDSVESTESSLLETPPATRSGLVFSTEQGDGWNIINSGSDYVVTGNVRMHGSLTAGLNAITIMVQDGATLTIDGDLELGNHVALYALSGGTIVIAEGSTVNITGGPGYNFNSQSLVINYGTINANSGMFRNSISSSTLINYGTVVNNGAGIDNAGKIINIPPNGDIEGETIGEGTILSGNSVTVTNGALSGGVLGNPMSDYFAENDTVAITAGAPPEGYQFDHWETADESVIFDDPEAENTTFTMPSPPLNPIEVTAVFSVMLIEARENIEKEYAGRSMTFPATDLFNFGTGYSADDFDFYVDGEQLPVDDGILTLDFETIGDFEVQAFAKGSTETDPVATATLTITPKPIVYTGEILLRRVFDETDAFTSEHLISYHPNTFDGVFEEDEVYLYNPQLLDTPLVGQHSLGSDVGVGTLIYEHDLMDNWLWGTHSSNYVLSELPEIQTEIQKASHKITVNLTENTKSHNHISVRSEVVEPTIVGFATDNGLITVDNAQVEYAISKTQTADMTSLTWQASSTFSNLEPDTPYYIYARVAGNDNVHSGEHTELAVRTNAQGVADDNEESGNQDTGRNNQTTGAENVTGSTQNLPATGSVLGVGLTIIGSAIVGTIAELRRQRKR